MHKLKAFALRQELRKDWVLPEEEWFNDSGPEWLLVPLNSVSKEIGGHILPMFWRAWHLRNNIIHGKGTGSVVGSARFLLSYSESLNLGSSTPKSAISTEGKGKMFQEAGLQEKKTHIKQKWEPPPPGWVKVNTDAGFCDGTGESSAGVIVLNEKGLGAPVSMETTETMHIRGRSRSGGLSGRDEADSRVDTPTNASGVRLRNPCCGPSISVSKASQLRRNSARHPCSRSCHPRV